MGRNTLIAPNEKHRAIIELRERRLTYKEVGEQIGVTKQYVGQVLRKWRPDLACRGFAPQKPRPSTRKPGIEKDCRYCGERFGAWLRPWVAKEQRYCSKSCASYAKAGRTTGGVNYALVALAMRPKGQTWREIAAALGVSRGAVVKACRTYERETGADVSAAFCGHANHSSAG